MSNTAVETKLNKPRLRFKDDNGNDFTDWETKTLGSICKITTGKLDANAMVVNGSYRFYTCAREYYYIDIFAFDTEALLISGNGANVGYIHYYKGKFNAYQRTYVLDGFTTDIIYIKYFLERNLSNRIEREKKAGNTPYIVMDTLKNMILKIPAKKEQQKIADFLTSVDNWIDNLKAQKESLEKYKKGMMQKIFSREIRFKDDDENDFPDWEIRKLGTICEYKNGDSFEQSIVEGGKYNLISLNSMTIQGDLSGSYKTVSSAPWLLRKDDIVMVLSDVAHGYFLGLVDIIPENDKFVLNQRMGLLRGKNDKICTKYLRYYINHNQLYFKRHGQGSSQQNLSKGDIERFQVKLPSLQEQQKIADFLSSIDSQIELKQKQIENAQQWKKGLMQEMFV